MWFMAYQQMYATYYVTSTDDGLTWSAPVSVYIKNPQRFDVELNLVCSDSKALVLISSGSTASVNAPDLDIVAVRCAPRGSACLPPSMVHQNYTENTTERNFDGVYLNGTNWMVVWDSNMSGTRQLFLAVSTDDGVSWNASQALTSEASPSLSPEIDHWMGSEIIMAWESESPRGFRNITYTTMSITQLLTSPETVQLQNVVFYKKVITNQTLDLFHTMASDGESTAVITFKSTTTQFGLANANQLFPFTIGDSDCFLNGTVGYRNYSCQPTFCRGLPPSNPEFFCKFVESRLQNESRWQNDRRFDFPIGGTCISTCPTFTSPVAYALD